MKSLNVRFQTEGLEMLFFEVLVSDDLFYFKTDFHSIYGEWSVYSFLYRITPEKILKENVSTMFILRKIRLYEAVTLVFLS